MKTLIAIAVAALLGGEPLAASAQTTEKPAAPAAAAHPAGAAPGATFCKGQSATSA